MYDDLNRIEAAYGSVAEYNRSREEDLIDYRDPTDEEIAKAERDMDIYYEKIHLLNGEPSEFIKEFCEEWKQKEPKASDFDDRFGMGYIYAIRDFSRERTFALMKELRKEYGCEYSINGTDGKNFYRIPNETFAISVEYSDDKSGQIKAIAITDLDYETFKNIFRDLYYARCYPVMNFCDKNGKNVIVSNCSLGNIRMTDLKYCGLETEESLNKELEELGFIQSEEDNEISI